MMWKRISKILEKPQKSPAKFDVVVLELCQRHHDHLFVHEADLQQFVQ